MEHALRGEQLQAHVEVALREDLNSDSLDDGAADLTTSLLIQPSATSALIVAKESGIIAGTALAEAVFRRLDPKVDCEVLETDGNAVEPGATVMTMIGSAGALLTGERTALNFLQHLSGIATCTRRFVDAISASPGARITDTRKTTPGLRLLEKYAVTQGGGVNHRMGLYDAVLVKENHAAEAGGVAAAVKKVRSQKHHSSVGAVRVMVEARHLGEVEALLALEAPDRPDRILLDNMPPAALAEAVALIRAADAGSIEIEATGGVDLDTVAEIAATGVDLISVGALTHSAPALDLSLLFESVDEKLNG
jgi:nicotinate-nucleotide pyrophosphorylase (carboxylating)